jgi:hypothetical protein
MPQWVTQQKFIEETGLSSGAVRGWRKAGLIPAIKFRRKWMLDIEAFNDNLRTKANERIRIRTEPLSIKSYISFEQRRQKIKEENRRARQQQKRRL